jgi:hypothetical protein
LANWAAIGMHPVEPLFQTYTYGRIIGPKKENR